MRLGLCSFVPVILASMASVTLGDVKVGCAKELPAPVPCFDCSDVGSWCRCSASHCTHQTRFCTLKSPGWTPCTTGTGYQVWEATTYCHKERNCNNPNGEEGGVCSTSCDCTPSGASFKVGSRTYYYLVFVSCNCLPQ